METTSIVTVDLSSPWSARLDYTKPLLGLRATFYQLGREVGMCITPWRGEYFEPRNVERVPLEVVAEAFERAHEAFHPS